MPDGSIPPATERFAAHVGEAARRRPDPSLARAVGGFAALLAGGALFLLGADIVVGGGNRAGVALLFLLYAASGYALVVFGRPEQRTAGVTAVAVAAPAALGFLVLGRDGYSGSEPTTVLALSSVAWGVLHVAGPTRGHGLLLAAALGGAWGTVTLGLDALAVLDPPAFGPAPDPTEPAVISVLFGIGYGLTGAVLDRAGLRGTATAFLGVALVAVGSGAALAAVEGSRSLAGLLLLGAGAVLGPVGSRLGRRAVTWAGAAAAVAGLGFLAADPFEREDVRPRALAVLAASAVVVVLVPRLAAHRHEPPEAPQGS